MHRRQAVRDAVLAALALISADVVSRRVYLFGIAELPSVNVLTGPEAVLEDDEGIGTYAGTQARELAIDLELRVAVESTGTADDALDNLALEVEQALHDAMSAQPVDWWRYAGAEDVEVSDELETPIALRTLSYLAHYRVPVDDPQ